MIKKDLYIDYCTMALIPIGRHEKRILDKLTNKDGWFNEENYLAEAEKQKVFVTKNQLRLLKLMPQRYNHRSRRKLEAIGRFLGETFNSNKIGF